MKYITKQWVTYDEDTGLSTRHPYYIGRNIFGGRLVGEDAVRAGLVPSYLGVAYRDWDRLASVMYPKPFHLVVRLVHWLDYWTVLPQSC